MGLAVLITQTILGLVIAYFVGKILTSIFFYHKTLKDRSYAEKIENESAVDTGDDTISYGKYLSIIGALGIITGNIDKLFVWHFLGEEELAIYYIALAIPLNIVVLFNIVPKVAFPKFSRNSWDLTERKKILKKLSFFASSLIIPTLIYILVIPFILPFLFRDYSGSIAPALILAALMPIIPLNTIIGQIFRSAKAIRKLIIVRLLVLVAFGIVFLFTYKTLGVIGASVALVASELTILFFGIYSLAQKDFSSKVLA
jgi:O-antigen/teichoic acid export membrane protein